MKRIVIIGAGGYAKVIAETIDLMGNYQLVGFMDDHIEKGTVVTDQLAVMGPLKDIPLVSAQCDVFVIGIGNNEIRKQLAEQYSGMIAFETIIHPRAFVSGSASVLPGTVVLAGAVISANARVASHCIVNANVVVDHDCMIGEFTHLAIGTSVGSNSVVSSLLKTGVGQAIPSFSTI